MKKFLVKDNARVKQSYVDCSKTYSVHFTEQHKKFWVKKFMLWCEYLFVNNVEICKFQAKDFEKKQFCYCYEIIQKIL